MAGIEWLKPGVFFGSMLFALIGVLVFREAFDRDRAIGFIVIWVALAVFAADGLRRARRAAVD